MYMKKYSRVLSYRILENWLIKVGERSEAKKILKEKKCVFNILLHRPKVDMAVFIFTVYMLHFF